MKEFEKDFQENIGKKIFNNIKFENDLDSLTQLQLFHLLTNYISHRVKLEYQARYQLATSKLFKL